MKELRNLYKIVRFFQNILYSITARLPKTRGGLKRLIRNRIILKNINTGELKSYKWNRRMWKSITKSIILELKSGEWIYNQDIDVELGKKYGINWAIDETGKKRKLMPMFYKSINKRIYIKDPRTNFNNSVKLGFLFRWYKWLRVKTYLNEDWTPADERSAVRILKKYPEFNK